MIELYWINVIGNINIVLNILLATALTVIVFTFIFWLVAITDPFGDMGGLDRVTRVMKISVSAFIISITARVFIPSKQDLFLILGVGTTIDYIKENKELQELPDKCVKALNMFIESLEEKEK